MTSPETLAIEPAPADSLVSLPAVELADRIQSRDVSAREVMIAHLDRIDAVNPRINAVILRRDPEQLMAEAAAADATEPTGPLHGFPLAVKDLSDVAGIPTRHGSVITPDTPAPNDTLFVSRLRAAGAIFIGKTNTPEFGIGSHTFNEVFGMTRNPANPAVSAGGSSGGAAAGLAANLFPVADGSDLGGSLRNPGAFCGVVGFRPSIGRVPTVPKASGFINDLAVSGPMGRTVADAAFLLRVMAGPDPRDPRACSEDPSIFAPPLAPLSAAELAAVRVAWAGDLGLDWDAEAFSVPRSSLDRFISLGASVEEAAPDLSGSMETFLTFRAFMYRDMARSLPEDVWRQVKPTLIWNIEQGLALTVDDIAREEANRTRIHLEMTSFFERFDVLALPTTQVPPFSVDIEYPTEINGRPMAHYLEWMSSCCIITTTGCPAISVPCGTTADGRPLGLQLVGPRGGDHRLLQIAAAFEAAA